MTTASSNSTYTLLYATKVRENQCMGLILYNLNHGKEAILQQCRRPGVLGLSGRATNACTDRYNVCRLILEKKMLFCEEHAKQLNYILETKEKSTDSLPYARIMVPLDHLDVVYLEKSVRFVFDLDPSVHFKIVDDGVPYDAQIDGITAEALDYYTDRQLKLSRRIRELEQAGAASSSSTSSVNSFPSTITAEQLHDLELKLSAASKRASELEQQLAGVPTVAELREREVKLEEALARSLDLEAKIAQCTQSREEAQKRVSELESAEAELKKTHLHDTGELQRTIGQLNGELKKKSTELLNLQTKLGLENGKLNNQRIEYNKAIAELKHTNQGTLQELDAARAQVDALQKQYDAAMATNDKLQQKESKDAKRIAELEKNLAFADQRSYMRAKELGVVQGELKDLKAEQALLLQMREAVIIAVSAQRYIDVMNGKMSAS